MVSRPTCLVRFDAFQSNGAVTNLKAGAHIRRKAPEKLFFVPLNFWLYNYKCTINSFGERFRDGQYNLVSFLFAVPLLKVPPCPSTCNLG